MTHSSNTSETGCFFAGVLSPGGDDEFVSRMEPRIPELSGDESDEEAAAVMELKSMS